MYMHISTCSQTIHTIHIIHICHTHDIHIIYITYIHTKYRPAPTCTNNTTHTHNVYTIHPLLHTRHTHVHLPTHTLYTTSEMLVDKIENTSLKKKKGKRLYFKCKLSVVGSKFMCFYNLQRMFLLYLQLVVRRQKEKKDKERRQGKRKGMRKEGRREREKTGGQLNLRLWLFHSGILFESWVCVPCVWNLPWCFLCWEHDESYDPLQKNCLWIHTCNFNIKVSGV